MHVDALLCVLFLLLFPKLGVSRKPHPRVYVYNLGPQFREGGIRDELEREVK